MRDGEVAIFVPPERRASPESRENLYPTVGYPYRDNFQFEALPEEEPAAEEGWTHEYQARRGGHRKSRLPGARRLRGRRRRSVIGVMVFLFVLLLSAPLLDAQLARVVSERVAGQMACPGGVAQPPKVTVKGGLLLPQVLRQRLSEIEIVLPDATIGGVKHAALSVTLRDVSQPEPDTALAGSMDASMTVGFASMPSMPGMPRPTFGRSPEGLLTIKVVPPTESTRNVKATLLAKLELNKETMRVVPQRLIVFGKAVPAAQVAAQTGGVRTQKLPHLPRGVAYRAITPKTDGLHVTLGGVVTTPFSDMPANVDGQPVTYTAAGDLLGISTSKSLPLIGDLPLTIFVAPRIDRGTLTLVPQSVEILGSNRKPDDPIAALVLSQIKQESLTRDLPALPKGVRYRSVSVDKTGIKMAIGGTTVRPFSELPAKVEGRPATYGARGGLLAVTSTGASSARPTPVILHAKPTIAGTVLDLSPQRIEMFGVLFPAGDVLAQVKTPSTRYPLQALPDNLVYQKVDVLADGLRINLSGRNVELRKGAFGAGANC